MNAIIIIIIIKNIAMGNHLVNKRRILNIFFTQSYYLHNNQYWSIYVCNFDYWTVTFATS